PGALAGRDGVVLEPLADRVVEEVLARTHRGVDELIEIVVGGDLLGRLGRRAASEPRQREKKEDRASHGRASRVGLPGGRTTECSREQRRPGRPWRGLYAGVFGNLTVDLPLSAHRRTKTSRPALIRGRSASWATGSRPGSRISGPASSGYGGR